MALPTYPPNSPNVATHDARPGVLVPAGTYAAEGGAACADYDVAATVKGAYRVRSTVTGTYAVRVCGTGCKVDSLFIGSDMDVTVTKLKARALNVYLNSAVVTWTLDNSAGTELGTGTLDYEAASNGNYTGVIESSVTDLLTDGEDYTLTVTAVQGDYDDLRRFVLQARYRRGDE